MTAADASLVAAILVALVFTIAAIAKLRDRTGALDAVRAFGVPPRLARPVSFVLPWAELGVAVMLVFGATRMTGALGALGLLAAFTAAIGLNLARGRAPECRCFGQLHSTPTSWRTLARNSVLAALAVAAAAGGRGPGRPGVVGAIGGLTPSAQATLAGGLLLALVAVGCAGAFASLTRAHGRVLVRLDRLEEELSAAGLRLAPETPLFELGLDPGTRAPEFVAETVRGDAVALGDLLAPGLPLVLVFTSPHCGPCTALMPRLSAWQAEHAATLTFAIASSGGREEIRAEAGDLGWALLDTDLALSGAFQAAGTPSAVLVAVDGTIASYVAAGADEIEQLVLAALAPDGSTWSEDRLSIGAPIPELTLFDLGGVPVDLVDPLGRTTLVLFWNPSCGFCGSARDDLLDWERRATTDTPRLVVVSSGDEDSTRADGFSSTVVLDESFAVGDAFGADGTPMAVLVDSSGRIASHLAAGRDAVLELATRISGGDQAAAAANGAGR